MSSFEMLFETVFAFGTVATVWTLECGQFSAFPFAMVSHVTLFFVRFATAARETSIVAEHRCRECGQRRNG